MTEPRTIAGRFALEQRAGGGAMGDVFRAQDLLKGGPVALKILRQSEDSTATERFVREAALLAELTHPAIVRYVANGQTPEGLRYLAMEWLGGHSLSERIKLGPLSVQESLDLGVRVASSLDHAHAHNVMHRDIKPSNLFLVDERPDRVKVIDFGVARRHFDELDLTATGAVVGTFAYMSPEQALGHGDVDPRADLFALGCVLWECLTGQRAFRSDEFTGVLAKILVHNPPPASELCVDVPTDFADLVAALMQKRPDDRPRDASEVVRRLEELASSQARGTIPVQRALTGSEARIVSVVLVTGAPEMDGSSTGSRSPDETVTEVSEVSLATLAERHGGRLDRLGDGSLLVTMTGTGSSVDHAVQAARCALALANRLPETSVTLATGRRVMSGQAPVGDVIDRALAARHDQGGIGVDAETANLLGAAFELAEHGTGVYLRGERRSVEGVRTLLGQPTTCVGRSRELAALEAIYEECCEEPVARAVLVTGVSGAGKSRVRYEFIRRVVQTDPPPQVLVGRGDALRAGSPFGLIAEAVKRAAGIEEGEELSVRREKLSAHVVDSVQESAGTVAAFLGELIRTPFPEESSTLLSAARRDAVLMGDSMRAAFEEWLLAQCRRRPVVLVLEDLHWGDLSTVKFVDAALRHLRDEPFTVLATARPEVHDVFPKLWSEHDLLVQRLPRLKRKACVELVREVLGAIVSDEDVQRLVRQADGNALYLEEVIRAHAESPEQKLPESVLAMVQARLDALGPASRRVLRAASVYGETFWSSGLLALLGGSGAGDMLDEQIALLLDAEVIDARSGSIFRGESEYVFRHALIQEAAYEMLTEADRVLGHQLAGDWLEGKGSTDGRVLAEHYRRGDVHERAAAWLLRTAEQALGGNDFDATLRYVADAFDSLAGDPQSVGRARALEAEAHHWQGELGRAVDRGIEAVDALTAGSALWFRALAGLLLSLGIRGRYDEVAGRVQGLLDQAWEPGADADRIACLCIASMQLEKSTHPEAADQVRERIDEAAADLPSIDRKAAASVHKSRAIAAHHAGDAGVFLKETEAAVEAFEEAGDVRHAAVERGNLGYGYAELGDLARAEELLRGALSAAERIGMTRQIAYCCENLGHILVDLGRPQEGRAFQERALLLAKALGEALLEGFCYTHLAALDYPHGDPATVERHARSALEVLDAIPSARPHAQAWLARATLMGGATEEALELARTAVDSLAGGAAIGATDILTRMVYAETLVAAGDASEAARVAADLRTRLMERGDSIDDPKLRSGFLRGVLVNRAAIDLADSLEKK